MVHYHPLQPTEPEIIAICSSHIHFFPSLIFPFQQQSKQNTKFLFFYSFFVSEKSKRKRATNYPTLFGPSILTRSKKKPTTIRMRNSNNHAMPKKIEQTLRIVIVFESLRLVWSESRRVRPRLLFPLSSTFASVFTIDKHNTYSRIHKLLGNIRKGCAEEGIV